MAKTFLKIAASYFTAGVLLGMTMGIIQDFRLASVHAHFNLLGWVSMALFGVIYHFYPHAAETRLAKTHFCALSHRDANKVMYHSCAFEPIDTPVYGIELSALASAVISPVTRINPRPTQHSQPTRAYGSISTIASKIPSEI